MKKILFVSSALILLHNLLIAQITERDFLTELGTASATSKDFTLSFNQPYNYNFDSSLILTGETNLTFNFNSREPSTVDIRNKVFEGFKNITFTLETNTVLTLADCKFINCGTVYFEFGRKEELYNDPQTKIKIANCEFTDTDLRNDSSNYSYQLCFRKAQSVGKEKCIIKNVEITGCSFNLNDTSASFLTKNKLLPSRYSVYIYRKENNVAVSNITVSQNSFKFNSPYYRTFGIIFLNDGNSNFRTPLIPIEEQFVENNTLAIRGNYMETNSNDPGHGIFVQGPYEKVRVTDNEVIGFGANFPGANNDLQRDGAIQLYGDRATSRYSNDLQNCDVSYNKVLAVGTAIRLSGTNNATVNFNDISISPDPAFYQDGSETGKQLTIKLDQAGINCRTGNFEDPLSQSRNLSIENNVINCNSVDRCIGIDIDAVKSFSIKNNKIYNPNNYGIIYHSNKGFINQEFGNSIIENNLIDFGLQNDCQLKSSWYHPRYEMEFSGINISREFSQNHKEISFESIVIRENIIKTNEDSEIEPIRVEKIETEDGIVKKKFYNIESNFLQTQEGLKEIPEIKY
ncbi:MAG: hypothetical protein ACHQLA_02375 [Ignavibacteriales bacterium]